MAKAPTLNDVASLANEATARSTINANFTAIETAFENTISRDGSTPNQMTGDLDMNSNRLLNLGAPQTDGEPIRLADLPAAAFTTTATLTSIADSAGRFTATNVEGALEEEANARLAHEARTDNPHSVEASDVLPAVSSLAIVKDATDATKTLGFNIAAIGTGVKRTITMPNADVDLTRIKDATTTDLGFVELATAGEVQTGTDTTRVPTVSVMGSHRAVTKAWVSFNGTGTVAIRSSYNVSSITDNGAGDYTINFTTALANNNYAMAASGYQSSTAYNVIHINSATAPTTTACRVVSVIQSAGTPTAWDSEWVSCAFFEA